MNVAPWTAGALALGWVATAAAAFVFGSGHPPAWFVVGEGVVMASFVIAPIGAIAGLINLRQTRRHGTRMPRLGVAALALNLLFLLVAVGLWLWLLSVTS